VRWLPPKGGGAETPGRVAKIGRTSNRARAVDVVDGFGHRLGHVGAGLEEQLHDRHALDIAGLDVVDAGDVEEVILVVVGQQPFHLGGIHAAVGLRNINDRQVQLGEDVDPHALHREHGATGKRDAGHDDRERVAQGKDDWIHGSVISEGRWLAKGRHARKSQK